MVPQRCLIDCKIQDADKSDRAMTEGSETIKRTEYKLMVFGSTPTTLSANSQALSAEALIMCIM